MTERLVAIERDGTLRLYTVNGVGPTEVGRLEVGPDVDTHTLAIIGAALSDLRAMIVAPSRGREPMPVRPRASVLDHLPNRGRAVELPSGPARAPRPIGGSKPNAGTLNGRVRAYLRDHPASRAGEIVANVGAEDTPGGKTRGQKVSTSLSTLKRAGMVTRDDLGRWSLA